MLVVLLILGILVAVVVVNVVGLTGRGGSEAYASDERTIQMAAAIFKSDVHAYSGIDGDMDGKIDGWNETENQTSVHNYPTRDGQTSTLYHGTETYIGKYRVYLMMKDNGPGNLPGPATRDDIINAAIWMGLLTNSPGDGRPGPDKAPPDDSGVYVTAPLAGEVGPYLNPLPASCSKYNVYNGVGSIVWIMGEYGRVYGVFQEGDFWYAGYGGRYP